MSAGEILSIDAIVLSPLIAIQVTKFLEKRTEKRLRRLYMFRTLMGTRASRLSNDHINALNMIDVEFYGNDKNSKQVVEAWKVYLDHLSDDVLRKGSIENWNSKGNDLFIDLLSKMAKSLNFEYDKSTLNKTAYVPVAQGELELDLQLIRRGVAGLFSGTISIPIKLVSDDSEKEQKRMRKMIEDYLQLNNVIKVQIIDDKNS